MPESSSFNLGFWAQIVGWVVMIFGGGSVLGHYKRQLDEHQKLADKCSSNNYITEEKCRQNYAERQERNEIQMAHIRESLAALVDLRTKFGELSTKIDVLIDRDNRNDAHK